MKGDKLVIVYKMLESSTSATGSSHMHLFFRLTLFSFNPSTFVCPGTTFYSLRLLFTSINHLSVLFRRLVCSVKDEKFDV